MQEYEHNNNIYSVSGSFWFCFVINMLCWWSWMY